MNRATINEYTDRTPAPTLSYPKYEWVDTAHGTLASRNNLAKAGSLIFNHSNREAYCGMFRFGRDYEEHWKQTGSVANSSDLVCFTDHVWFDIDRTNQAQALVDARQLMVNLEKLCPEIAGCVALYFSGAKGFHIGIPSVLFVLEPSVDLPAQVKRIAQAIAGKVEIDPSIYNGNRLWRVPNTINSKSGLYKIPLNCDEFATWSIEQIKEKAKAPCGDARPLLVYEGEYQRHPVLVEFAQEVLARTRPTSGSANQGTIRKESSWISAALIDLTEGNRNSTFASIAGRLHRDGWSERDILTLLMPQAELCAFEVAELEQVVHSICGRYPQALEQSSGAETYGWKPLSLSELLQIELTQPQWLVEPLYPSQGVAIIAGKPGIGKSWMLMDLAIAIARGESWLGKFDTRQSTVGYIDLESSPQMLQSRFRMLLNARDVTGELDISFLIGPDLSFSSGYSLAKLDDWLRKIKPGIVIIDCLIRSHGSDENSATDMAKVFRKVKSLVREHQCFFIIADHHRKPGEQEASADTMLRGSSEKLAFVDCLVSLRQDGKNIVFEHSKARQGKAVDSFVLCLEDHGEDKIWLRVVGDRAALKKQETDSAIMEFLKSVFADSAEASRKMLIEQARKRKIGPKSLDAFLKSAPEDLLIREGKRRSPGKGGKEAHYRPGSAFPFSSPYIGEKRGTENSDGEAA